MSDSETRVSVYVMCRALFVIVILIVATRCPSIAAGQIFGKGARTEFINGFGLRTFGSVQERNDCRGDDRHRHLPEGGTRQMETSDIGIG